MNSTVVYTLMADPVSLPIISSPWLSVLISGIYMYFVLKLGRDFMECRKPYDVRNAMLIYNLIQVIFNVIIFGMGFYYLLIEKVYDLRCMSKLPMDHPYKNIEIVVAYAYFLNKVMDLLDTVFFVLRKSYKQITVLHVYHHVLMVAGMSILTRMYGPAGHYFMMGMLNCLVHACMYSYYYLSALYPQLKGILWWKKFITKFQILQFVILVIQSTYVLVFNPQCNVPTTLYVLQLLISISMIVMFCNFYYHAYIKVKRLKTN